jgi:LCP family protein required for cell wall assembly
VLNGENPFNTPSLCLFVTNFVKKTVRRKLNLSPKSTSRWIIIIVGIIIVIALILVVPLVKTLWNKPLGQTIDLPTITAGSETIQATPFSGGSTFEPTITQSPTITSLCGGPSSMIIEALGENQVEHLTDVIRIARVDFVTPKVTVLDIPRDTWVPPLSDSRITNAKINQAFQFGINAPWRNNPITGKPLYDGPGGGAGLMARTLDLNFGLRVDNYGTVDMDTFVKIVDAVGGIDVNLPMAISGSKVPGDPFVPGYYPAGLNHLDGAQALNFARIRKCDGCTTYTRTSNQNIVLCALRDKLLTPSVLPDIPNIIGSLKDAIQTDLSPAQISQLVCLLPHLTKQNIVFTEPPEEMFKPTQVYDTYAGYGTTAFEVDPQFLVIIQQFVNGIWPLTQTDSAGSFCP